jgi:hypothetical protein
MADYDVNTYTTEDKDYAKVVSDLETQIEDVDNGKTIRLLTILPNVGNTEFVGILIYDA